MAGDVTATFDYVIVGGGSAGSLLANRLTEDGSATVCVLEAGPPDRNPFIHIPAGFTKTLFDPSCTWQFKTEPTSRTGGRAISTTQGRTLGGSSSVNGMVWNRGQPADLDNWAQRGNRGWGFADVLPYYRQTERRIGFGDDRVRGRSGGIPVTDMDWLHPVSEAFIAGCVAAGIPRNPDYNSGDQAGVGYFQRAILKGRRVSAARAFLKPARRRSNLEVRTGARASGIILVWQARDRDPLPATARRPGTGGARAPRGHLERWNRQHGAAAAALRDRPRGAPRRIGRARPPRIAGRRRKLPRPLRRACRRARETGCHHIERALARPAPCGANGALGVRTPQHSGDRAVSRASVLAVLRRS